MKLRLGGNGDAPGQSLWLWCPGCEDAHRVVVGTEGSWSWDGNVEAPTISPSILVHGVQWPPDSPFRRPGHPDVAPGEPTACHSFVVAGVWTFLQDCTHVMAGLSVPMPDIPDWLAERET